MSRFRGSFVVLALIGTTGVGLTSLRAASQSDVPSHAEQIAELTSRLEKLEKRLAILEIEKEHATRQANAVVDSVPSAPPSVQWRQGETPKTAPNPENEWPQVRIRLLKWSQPSDN